MVSNEDCVNKGLLQLTIDDLGYAAKKALSQVQALLPFQKVETIPKEVLPVSAQPLPDISLDQVSWHDSSDDCWIVVYDRVYNVTSFLREHPGGDEVILEYAGRDATFAFRGVGHTAHAWRALEKYLIGQLPVHERIFKIGSEKIFENAPFSSSLAVSA